MVRPTLIAWFDRSEVASPAWASRDTPAQPSVVEPVAEPPVVAESSAAAPPRFLLGVRVGARDGGVVSGHVELAPELRYRHWRLIVDANGDRASSQSHEEVASRLSSIELGAAVGRDFLHERFWVGLGGQARRSSASIDGTAVISAVHAWDYGGRLAALARIWSNDRVDIGVSARVSVWHSPLRLLYEGRELQRQTHTDIVVAPYLAVRLN
jgi:hypothetical protein